MIMDARKQRNVRKLRSDVLGGQRISGLSAVRTCGVTGWRVHTGQWSMVILQHTLRNSNKCLGKKFAVTQVRSELRNSTKGSQSICWVRQIYPKETCDDFPFTFIFTICLQYPVYFWVPIYFSGSLFLVFCSNKSMKLWWVNSCTIISPLLKMVSVMRKVS